MKRKGPTSQCSGLINKDTGELIFGIYIYEDGDIIEGKWNLKGDFEWSRVIRSYDDASDYI